MILCLFRMGVLDGGLKVKVLGGILSVHEPPSHWKGYTGDR